MVPGFKYEFGLVGVRACASGMKVIVVVNDVVQYTIKPGMSAPFVARAWASDVLGLSFISLVLFRIIQAALWNSGLFSPRPSTSIAHRREDFVTVYFLEVSAARVWNEMHSNSCAPKSPPVTKHEF